jgi:hypothetical protein
MTRLKCRGRPPVRGDCREGPCIELAILTDRFILKMEYSIGRVCLHDSFHYPLARMTISEYPPWTIPFATTLFTNGLCCLHLNKYAREHPPDDLRHRIPIPHVRARAWVNYTCCGSTRGNHHRHNQIPNYPPSRHSATMRNGRDMSGIKVAINCQNDNYIIDNELYILN